MVKVRAVIEKEIALFMHEMFVKCGLQTIFNQKSATRRKQLYGVPCVKLRNIKFCIIFLVKLRAISCIVAIYVYCCNMCQIVAIYVYCCNLCKLLQFMHIAKKTLNRL